MQVVLLFPGQGSQRPGMIDAVPETDALVRLLDAAEALTGSSLRRVASEGPPSELVDTRVAQPLLYLADWAWGRALLDVGVSPGYVAGHSLGELAALAVAGVFSPEAGLELVCERARIMSETAAKTSGGMAAVLGLDADIVSAALDGIADVWVANDNAPGQIVISGAAAGIEMATAALQQAGARRVVRLDVGGPFHSPLMQPAADAFASIIVHTEMADAAIPVLQNTRPTPTTSAEEIRAALLGQISSPVRWTETMRFLAGRAPITAVESGPGTVLRGLARRIEGIAAVSVEEIGLEALVEEVLR